MDIIFDKRTEGCEQDQVCTYTWEDQKKRLLLTLPIGLTDMTIEEKQKNYPMTERPEIIMEDEQEEIQFTVQFTNKALKKEETETAVRQVHEMMKRAFTQYKLSPFYVFQNKRFPIGWFLMQMEMLQKEHIKAIFSIKGYMVIISFTYPERNKLKWRVFIKYLFASVRENGDI